MCYISEWKASNFLASDFGSQLNSLHCSYISLLPFSCYIFRSQIRNLLLLIKHDRRGNVTIYIFFFAVALRPDAGHGLLILEVSRSHTQRRTKVSKTPLDEWSARRRDLYLATHNTHNRQTSMTPVGFEPTISAGERPQTYALDRAVTGTGNVTRIQCDILKCDAVLYQCFGWTCHFHF